LTLNRNEKLKKPLLFTSFVTKRDTYTIYIFITKQHPNMEKITSKRVALLVMVMLLTFYGQAQITAQQAIVSMGRGINLGNTFDAPNEGDWADPAQEYYFDMYQEAGFKTVRIPITWSNHLGTSSPYTINETFLSRIEEVVKWGLERGMFVIINAHHEEWIKNTETFNAQKPRFYALWEQLSERFKDYPDSLLFEILNEPHYEVGTVSKSITQAQLDELNKAVLDIIRAKNPTRITIYGGKQYSNSGDLLSAAIPDPQDAYLMGYFHSYDPWDFAGKSIGTWGTASDVQTMVSKFAGVETWSKANNIPVLIGEFGAMWDCDYNSRMFYYATYTEQALAHGLAFTTWDDDGWFQVLQRTNAKWNDMKDILIHASDSSITALKLQTVDDTAIQISWTSRAGAGLLEKVLIEKKMANTEFSVIGELKQTSGTTYIDRSTAPSQESYYRILEVYASDTIPSYPAKLLRVATERSPFSGTPIPIPGTLQAENYDTGGEMLTFHDTDFVNQGGYVRSDGVDIKKSSTMYYVYNVEVGEWLEYTIDVAKAGTYSVTAYLASVSGAGIMQLDFGYIHSSNFTVPKTSTTTTMKTVTLNVNLEAGVQIMRLNIIATPTFSIDKLEFSEYISIDDNKEDVFSVYPNPVTDHLTIELTGGKMEIARIYNHMGQLVLSKNVDTENTALDVSELKAGMYFILVEANSTTSKATFIKQ
jgi:aryl-phospho-beta-D-glucosidase BglC (GH1 family)